MLKRILFLISIMLSFNCDGMLAQIARSGGISQFNTAMCRGFTFGVVKNCKTTSKTVGITNVLSNDSLKTFFRSQNGALVKTIACYAATGGALYVAEKSLFWLGKTKLGSRFVNWINDNVLSCDITTFGLMKKSLAITLLPVLATPYAIRICEKAAFIVVPPTVGLTLLGVLSPDDDLEFVGSSNLTFISLLCATATVFIEYGNL